MPKVAAALVFLLVVCSTGLASSTPIEVLYTEAHSYNPEEQSLLYTYNINPQTATAEQVGTPLPVPGTSIDPLTVSGKHVLYLWNGTDVWKYNTNSQGVPAPQASQHLKFDFPYPILSFLVDPNGKFAYAAINFYNPYSQQDYASIVLFTIDPLNGDLTDTGRVVARYGPGGWIINYLFGVSGRRLYFFEEYTGPFECGGNYDFYDVNQESGSLGKDTFLMQVGTYCGLNNTGTFSDTLTVVGGTFDASQGNGSVAVNQTLTGQNITCTSSMLTFCGDEVASLNIDPASKNIFVADLDTAITYVAHIDFQNSQLLPTPTPIQNSYSLFFSPDSKIIYSLSRNATMDIYAFNPNTGQVTPGGFLLTVTGFPVATATLAGE
jgi:hypothetical protein